MTGSGKTFTMANIIAQVNKPTLVLAHNKTLAAQLCSEFKEFFPENAVEYFVSYYDYYQPEAYIPQSDTYIEKDSAINDEIDKLRHSATLALSERRDVIIVASVSCIYSLGDPIDYRNMVISLRPGMEKSRDDLIRKLIELQYERNDINFVRDKFRVRGDIVEIFPASSSDRVIRVEFFGDEIDRITEINPLTGELIATLRHAAIYPASHYIVDGEKMARALAELERELQERLKYFRENGKLLEAQRIEQRTHYDIEMLQEIGMCPGVENYSRVLSGRAPGSAPFTLLDYFPKDFLLFVDESHVTLPQVRGMYGGDHARKKSLIDYGFRLPSAYDNRPLNFDEFYERLNQAVFVSATPGDLELEKSAVVAEQIIRPDGTARSRDLRQTDRGSARRPDLRDQYPNRKEPARSGDDPHQEDGGGSDRVPREHGYQGALYAPRYRHRQAHGDRPRPATAKVRRAWSASTCCARAWISPRSAW